MGGGGLDPARRAAQERALAEGDVRPRWVSGLEDIPTDAPVILVANEVLDCLPARQFVRTEDGWMERRVGLDDDGGLTLGLAPITGPFAKPDYAIEPGQVVEVSDAQAAFGAALGRLLARTTGAALLIDYGRDRPGPGDTLQAVRGHKKEGPLDHPGEADLTQWADFPAVMEAAVRAGADVTGCVTQGALLRSLGVQARAEALKAARPAAAEVIDRQLERLTAPDKMGELFKACAIFSPPSLVVPGFEG